MHRLDRPPATDAWLTPARFGVVLALLVFAAFPEVLTGTRSFFHRDFGVLAYPTVAFHREAFWRGEFPLWNPLSHCGVPFLAQWGAMALYPGALIYLVLPLPWSLNLFCLAHLWLGGLGMFHLARRWSGSNLGAAIAGVAFTFNGLSQSCLLWPNYTVALGWMPWVVWLVTQAAATGGRSLLIAALGAAAQLLAGAPEITAMTWLVATAMAWVERPPGLSPEIRNPKPEIRPAPTVATPARLLRVMTILVIAMAVTAVQLLPFLALLLQSQRAAGTAGVKWALPSLGWINFIAPLFRCEPTAQGTWFLPGQHFFGSVYLGAGMLGLAGLGCFRRGDPRAWTLGALAALGLGLATAPEVLGYNVLGNLLPGFLVPRYPVKFVLLVAFCVPLLAALGIAAVTRASQGARVSNPPLASAARGTEAPAGGREPATSLSTMGIVAALALGGVAVWTAAGDPGPAPPRAMLGNLLARLALLAAFLPACYLALTHRHRVRAGLALLAALALLVLDYRTHLPNLTPTLDAALLRHGRMSADDLPLPAAGRVFIPGPAEAALLLSRVPDFGQDFLGKRFALWSNLNLLESVAKVSGAATLRLQHQAELESALLAATNALHLPLLDFLAVTHHTSPSNVTEWVRRPTSLPLVTAGQRPVLLASSATRARVLASDFAPGLEVILADDGLPQPSAAAAKAVIEQLEFGAGLVRFVTVCSTPTMAVIAQTHHGNWQATVDDSPTAVWRANHAFQAVAVPGGRHRVELRYRDQALRVGLALSLLTLVAGGAWWWRLPRGRL